jgi:proteasome-associated ATPase
MSRDNRFGEGSAFSINIPMQRVPIGGRFSEPSYGGRSREELAAMLARSEQLIAEQRDFIEKVKAQPSIMATVLHAGPDGAVVAHSAGQVRLPVPTSLGTIAPGDTLLLSPQLAVLGVDRSGAMTRTGIPCAVTRVLDAGRIEVSFGMDSLVVICPTSVKVEIGDRVILDPTRSVALASLGSTPVKQEFTADTRVTWDDIGGQVEAKRQLRAAIEGPTKHAELYRRYGKSPTKGVLLYGPPGCGKTMLGKAAATAIAEAHGTTAGGFIYVKGPEIHNKYVGESEANVRAIFARSRAFHKKHGHRCIVFIDEADAVMGARGDGATTMDYIDRNLVAAFLTEMDGLEDSGAIVILSTNRPDSLDPAVVRSGRIDAKVHVTRPKLDDCTGLFELCLRSKHLATGSMVRDLAESAALDLFDAGHVLRELQAGPTQIRVPLSVMASGSLIAGIVENATLRAMHAEIEGAAPGITAEHLSLAIADTCRQNEHVKLDAEIIQYIREHMPAPTVSPTATAN